MSSTPEPLRVPSFLETRAHPVVYWTVAAAGLGQEDGLARPMALLGEVIGAWAMTVLVLGILARRPPSDRLGPVAVHAVVGWSLAVATPAAFEGTLHPRGVALGLALVLALVVGLFVIRPFEASASADGGRAP